MTDHYSAMNRGVPRCPSCGGVPGQDCDCDERCECGALLLEGGYCPDCVVAVESERIASGLRTMTGTTGRGAPEEDPNV